MTKQRVKQLTPDGIKLAREFLRDIRDDKAAELPNGLLTDTAYARDISASCFVEKRTFANRRDAGQYLSQALEPLGIGETNGNYPLWSWLGMFFLESLVDKDEQERFKIGRIPDYAFVIDVSGMDTRDFLSNRLMLSWETYRYHGDQYASWMLEQPVMSIPKLVERTIRSRQRFASHGIIKLIGLLYIDQATRRVRTRAGADDAVGGIRRLNDVLDQLYMTYDVYGMSAEKLLAILPEEFKHFNAAAGSARKR